MDNFAILQQKLTFLRAFYDLTTRPFREIQRKIDAHEEPYVPRWDGEDEPSGEPPFLDEWLEAAEGLTLQEQACLSLLQRSFREFLVSTVRNHPGGKPMEGGNWFQKYQQWFLTECDVDWTQAPVNLGLIEELSLARNCIQHGGESHGGPGDVLDSWRLLKVQSTSYHARFPDAFFASEFEKGIWKESSYPQPVTIELTPDKLDAAIRETTTLCQFIAERVWMWG